MDNKLLCRETIPGFLEPLLGEDENPCQLLEQLEDAGEEWEAWYQKYYAQVLHNAFILSLSTAEHSAESFIYFFAKGDTVLCSQG